MNHTNDSNGTTALKVFPSIPLPEFSGISMAIFAVIGVIANGLVLLVLIISQRKQFSTYRYLISHLAFADFLCSIMHIVYVPVELKSHDWLYTDFACKIVYPSITFFEILAIGTIIIISLERYKGVILPHSAAWKKYNIWLALGVVWILGLLLIVPNVVYIKVTTYKNLHYCNEYWGDSRWQQVYGISFFLIAFFLPAVSIAIMHIHIMCRLHGRNLKPSNQSNHRNRNDSRIVRVLTGIILAFFICTSPNKILYLVWDIWPKLEKDPKSRTRFYLRTFQVLYFARVAVDPLLYCFFDTRFKQDFQNTKRTMRGISVSESDQSRTRTRTISTNPATIEPSLVISNHQANIIRYSGSSSGIEVVGQPTLTIIQEATALNISVPSEIQVLNNEKRKRTESIATERTSIYGSSSPFGLSSLMTEL